jgi:hypothetical protein
MQVPVARNLKIWATMPLSLLFTFLRAPLDTRGQGCLSKRRSAAVYFVKILTYKKGVAGTVGS